MQKRLQSGDWPVFASAAALPDSTSTAAKMGAKVRPNLLLRCDLKT
jgi:hypothetical protein